MKKLFTIMATVLLTASLFAQAPQKMSYQAVIRNSSNALVTSSPIGMSVSILQGSPTGTEVYREIYNPNPQTNINGLVTIEIGGGIPLTGTFSAIDWSAGTHFIKTEIDPAGGTSYSITGTSQLLSVPYALHAKSVATEADPIFTVSPASGITGSNITNWNSAFGWGNHDGLYRPISWLPSWTDVTAKPTTFTPAAHTHGNITNEGQIGTIASSVVVTAKGGTLTALKAGTTTQYLRGDGTWGTPLTAGTADGQMLYWNGSSWINVPPGTTGQVLTFISGVPVWTTTAVGLGEVLNPTTGKIWMDRNLGALRVAGSGTDADAYGDLYQWGRGTDGHQIITSGTTTTLSSSDTPGHGNFILAPAIPYDWRSPQNDNLWQGVSGTNNPCPSGYRLPTEAEWEAERTSWSSNNAAGAFASLLKLPVAGFRSYSSGSLLDVGSYGYCWSSTVSSADSRKLVFYSSNAGMSSSGRARGYSVRCLKD